MHGTACSSCSFPLPRKARDYIARPTSAPCSVLDPWELGPSADFYCRIDTKTNVRKIAVAKKTQTEGHLPFCMLPSSKSFRRSMVGGRSGEIDVG